MRKLTIPGKPIAKKRPKFARRGKFVMTYNDQETEEGRFLLDVRQQWDRPPMEGAIALRCVFCMPIPKGTSKKKEAAMVSEQRHHVKKPDLDNLLKFVKDCCNNVLWGDDSQVAEIEARKVYSVKPRTEIEIIGIIE